MKQKKWSFHSCNSYTIIFLFMNEYIRNIKYASHTKNFLNNLHPIAFGLGFKSIIAADDSGVIFFWKGFIFSIFVYIFL